MRKANLYYRVQSVTYLFLVLMALQFVSCSSESTDDLNEDDVVIAESLTKAESLLILVNESRKEEGLASLILNDALNEAALLHSIDMEENDYFNHVGLNGSLFWERVADAGYTGNTAGENIAKGQRTVESVHSSWMNSDGHRKNILNESITEMGLGNSGVYWTQVFGKAK